MQIKEFEQITAQSTRPVVFEIWATWCAPCRSMAVPLESIAREYDGKVDLVKINADESKDLIIKLNIPAVPSMLVYWQGKQLSRIVGAQSEESIRGLFLAAAKHLPAVGNGLPIADRVFRILVGLLLFALGFSLRHWIILLLGVSGLVLAIYDRCPIIRSVLGLFKKRPAG